MYLLWILRIRLSKRGGTHRGERSQRSSKGGCAHRGTGQLRRESSHHRTQKGGWLLGTTLQSSGSHCATSSSSIPGSLSEMHQILVFTPDLLNQKLGMGLSQLFFVALWVILVHREI